MNIDLTIMNIKYLNIKIYETKIILNIIQLTEYEKKI